MRFKTPKREASQEDVATTATGQSSGFLAHVIFMWYEV